MTDSELQAQVAAATAYEEYFVPGLFQDWAVRVADDARLGPGQRVLDVACGTGVLAREAATRVGPDGAVTGLDPSPGMLSVAARLAPEVQWQQGTAEALPFPDRSFDAVLSQFGLMFFTDRRLALREMLRVLTPGGRLAVAVWDSLEHIPVFAAEVALVRRIAGPRAAEALRMPFALGDRRELEALFASAGMESLTITTARGVARFPSIRWLVEADVTGWLPLMGVDLPPEQVQRILEEADPALAPLVREDEGIVFDLSAHLVTGAKP